MGGDVAFAGFDERINHAVAAHRLQCLADRGDVVAVVDEKREPALADEPAGELVDQAVRGGARLDDVALLAGGLDERLGLTPGREDKPARLVEGDHAFAPAIVAAHVLAHRQRVEEFVADEDRRALGGLGERRRPGDRRAGGQQRVVLDLGERRARLDQRHVERGAKFRDDARGAQGVAHQGAASGSEFDEPQRIGPAHHAPHLGRPKADQLAEHLRDLRGGGEVARRAEGIAVHVIAELGMRERQLHVALDRDRAFLRDEGLDMRAEFAHAGARLERRLQAMNPRPMTTMGAERTMPIVRPPPSFSRYGSGSRNNSQKIRARP